MTLVEVSSRKDEQLFLEVHNSINRSFPHWVQPLNHDILSVFDPKKNKAFATGAAQRWLLLAGSGRSIGRLAAFVNKKYKNKGDTFPVGGIGFFDCIDQQEAANLLFDTAREWLLKRGMRAMDGPINFGERDRWWGLLVEGFHAPLYGMNYNPPYYQRLFENYGFQNFYNQICWSLPVANASTQLQPRFYEAHARYATDPAFNARFVTKKEFGKLVHDFCTVYNKAWAQHEGNKEISEAQAARLFKALKPIIDEKLIWFVYHHEQPIAMWISIPDMNQLIYNLNGRFGWLEKAKFMINRYRGACTRFVGIIYGIVPEFQGSGVDYYMIVEAEKVIKKQTSYRETELQWQGDFNPKMLNISRNLGAMQSRRLVTYRYIFDREVPFHRHPMLS